MSNIPTEEKSIATKLRERADRWQPWIDDDLEAEIGYLPDHMRYHQALDRAAADEIERLHEEDRQWDKHSLVEIVRERDRLRELLWRIQPILNAGSEIAFKVEREIGSVHTNRAGPLHGDVPAEPTPCEHLRSELLAEKTRDGEPLFQMRKCMDCSKTFRVRTSLTSPIGTP